MPDVHGWEDRAEDPICPSCGKVTSVRWTGKTHWCESCDLGFVRGDHERVSAEWRDRFRAARARSLRPCEVVPQPIYEPPPSPCATCGERHPHHRRGPE